MAAVYVSFWPTKERAAGKGAVEQVLPGSAERVGGLVGWMAERGACRDLQQTLAKNTKRGDQLSAAFGCSAKSVFGVWRGDTTPLPREVGPKKKEEFGKGNTQKSIAA